MKTVRYLALAVARIREAVEKLMAGYPGRLRTENAEWRSWHSLSAVTND